MSFDPNTFLNATFDEANDTKVVPVPVGEYQALADKVEVKTWSTKDGSQSGIKLEIIWDILDDNVKALLGRDTIKVKQDQMLDLTESGAMDFSKGKNIGLGRIREALDLNTPGQPLSFGQIQGRLAKVLVSHRVNGEDVYSEIKKIAKAQ